MMVNLIKTFLFSFLFLSYSYFGALSFDNVGTLNFNYTDIYKSCDDTVYFSYKNTLFSIKDKVLKEVFFIESGIKGIAGKNGKVVVFSTSEVFVIDSLTSKLLWNKKIKGVIMSEPVIGDNFLYIDKNSSSILAFDLYNGELIWKLDVSLDEYLIYHGSKILLSKDYLIYIVADAKVVVLYKNNGKKIKSFDLSVDPFTLSYDFEIKKVLLYNDILYIYYTNNDFIVFDTLTGTLCYKLENFIVLDFFIYKDKLVIINKFLELKIFDKFSLNLIYSNKLIILDKLLFCKVLYKSGLLLIYNSLGELLFFNLNSIEYDFISKMPFKIKSLCFNNSEKLAYIFSSESKVFIFELLEILEDDDFDNLNDYEKNNDYR